jgi:hypothetical protein
MAKAGAQTLHNKKKKKLSKTGFSSLKYKVNNKSHSIIHQGLSIAKASDSPVPLKLATLS